MQPDDRDQPTTRRAPQQNRVVRHAAVAQWRLARLSPTARALLWAIPAGLMFTMLNAIQRYLTLEMDVFQAQFLRYLCGLLVMLPLVWHAGFAAYRPKQIGGQFARGAVHTVGLCIWFVALPHIALAETTAIGFTTPFFIMIGAALVLREPMRWERWVAAGIGFLGVLLVVGPKLGSGAGGYSLLMLASAPVFAASFLMTKSLTRYERPTVIVFWQGITVTLFSLPLAFWGWSHPTTAQWLLFFLSGLLGSGAHYCITKAFSVADISASQSVKFLDLVWAAILGWLVFADQVSTATLIGGTVICLATLWIARREAKR